MEHHQFIKYLLDAIVSYLVSIPNERDDILRVGVEGADGRARDPVRKLFVNGRHFVGDGEYDVHGVIFCHSADMSQRWVILFQWLAVHAVYIEVTFAIIRFDYSSQLLASSYDN